MSADQYKEEETRNWQPRKVVSDWLLRNVKVSKVGVSFLIKV